MRIEHIWSLAVLVLAAVDEQMRYIFAGGLRIQHDKHYRIV